MSHKYCPQCGGSVSNDAKYCYQCGAPLSSTSPLSQPTQHQMQTSPTPQSSNSRKTKKKSRKISIGYMIFLIIALFLLLLLILHKCNAPEEKPLKSLPSERPLETSLDTLPEYETDEENGELTTSSIPLSSTMPDVHIPDIPASLPSTDAPYVEDDNTHSYHYEASSQDYSLPSSASAPSNLTTEQSIRNLLVSNRFTNSEGESITFSDNGNKLMMNGETIATAMEIESGFTSTHATMIFENGTSNWDVALSTDGGKKRIRYMADEYVAQ